MPDVIFTGFGIDIIQRFGQYYIRYDAGEISDKFVEDPITYEEAHRAQLSEDDAYQVIISAQNRNR